MSEREPLTIRAHEDPDLFREAVDFTATSTGFSSRLIEKDYFGSVVLDYLAARDDSLTFRGGTCLAKVYAGFHRLSEDLDFAIPAGVDASRIERSRLATGVKKAIRFLPVAIPAFRIVEPLEGANNSTQYIGVIGYDSLLSRDEGRIKIEVGLREPLFLPVMKASARTMLLDPISHEPMVKDIKLRCMSKAEAFAEKFRAALSRREVAIRDFFDIDHAVRTLAVHPQDDQMVRLVKAKLAVPGNEPVNISEARLAALRLQLDPELKPVLRQRDFREFDLERVFHLVSDMARRLPLHQ